MDAQIKKGLLDVCVLAVLNRAPSYGWQIIKDLSDIVEVSESTLYPVLKRLEGGGGVETYEITHNGRLRKYFRITNNGKQKLKVFRNEQQELIKIYNFISESVW